MEGSADGSAVVRMVFAKLSHDAPETDAEMLEDYRKTGQELVEYARKTGLFAVPADYRLDVTVTPPPLQAAIEGARLIRHRPSKQPGSGDSMSPPQATTLRSFARSTTCSDGGPGGARGLSGPRLALQGHDPVSSRISPIRWLTPGAVEDSSSMWQDSMAAEGWGLYSESLPAEPQAAAPRLQHPRATPLSDGDKIYRDLRVRIDTGIHTGACSSKRPLRCFRKPSTFCPGSVEDAKALKAGRKTVSCDAARRAITRIRGGRHRRSLTRWARIRSWPCGTARSRSSGSDFSPQRFHLEFMRQGTIPRGLFRG